VNAPPARKGVRANPVSSAAEAGNFSLIRGGWITAFLDEAVSFPDGGSHDDQVDAVSLAVKMLAGAKPPRIVKPAVMTGENVWRGVR
jgi:predicted phage terminase large subunit-like protein